MVARLAAERIGRLDELEDKLEVERERLSAFQDIGIALGSNVDLDDVLAMVLTRVSTVLNADKALIYLLDEENAELWCKVHLSEVDVHEIRLGAGRGIAGWVAHTGEAANVEDAYLDERFDVQHDRLAGYRTRTVLCVPMRNHLGRILGVLQVINKNSGTFDQSDEQLLTALASQTAVAIENSKLFLSLVGKNMELLDIKEQLEVRVRELDVLFEIARLSAQSSRLDDLLEGVLEQAMRALQAEAAAILIVDESGKGDLRVMTQAQGGSKMVRRLNVAHQDNPKQWIEQSRGAHVQDTLHEEANAVAASTLADRAGLKPKSMLAIPLVWESGQGLLELYNKENGQGGFVEEDTRFATTIGRQLASAITLAVTRSRAQQQDRLSTIGQLLSGVLHDVKTPMAVVSGYIQMMMNEVDEAQRRQYGEKILRQIDFINSMARETLAFARGDRGLWVRKVYLSTFFEDLLEQLKKSVEGRPVTVELELDDRSIAYFDQLKIQRAIHNLVRNAWEALGKGGGKVTLKVTRQTDNALRIDVIDNGPGISEAIRDRLFQSFATYGKEGGTGLGLAIVKKIVDDHRGTIHVESQPGRTAFVITIPQLDQSYVTRLTPVPGTLRAAVPRGQTPDERADKSDAPE